MPRDRTDARWLAGALLGVVALGLAAATLNSTVTEPSGGSGGPPGEGSGWLPAREPATTPVDAIDVPFLAELLQILLLLLLVLAIVWAFFNRREALVNLVALAVAVGIGYLLFRLLRRFAGGSGEGGPRLNSSGGGGLGGGSAATGAAPVDLPIGALLALLGLALAVAVAAVLRSAAGSGPDEAERGDDEMAAAVGRAAGRAADRIRAGTTADNEVYRAWREMTDLLDVSNPETSTPGEFAAAAVDAGMTREDVAELTALFETVRYGGAEPSAGLERRAVAAFERIEATYAEDE